jgi:hypothetical protein
MTRINANDFSLMRIFSRLFAWFAGNIILCLFGFRHFFIPDIRRIRGRPLAWRLTSASAL